jgi:hypothetical protein
VKFLGKVPIIQKNGLFRERPEKVPIGLFGLFGLNIAYNRKYQYLSFYLGLGLLYAIFIPCTYTYTLHIHLKAYTLYLSLAYVYHTIYLSLTLLLYVIPYTLYVIPSTLYVIPSMLYVIRKT